MALLELADVVGKLWAIDSAPVTRHQVETVGRSLEVLAVGALGPAVRPRLLMLEALEAEALSDWRPAGIGWARAAHLLRDVSPLEAVQPLARAGECLRRGGHSPAGIVDQAEAPKQSARRVWGTTGCYDLGLLLGMLTRPLDKHFCRDVGVLAAHRFDDLVGLGPDAWPPGLRHSRRLLANELPSVDRFSSLSLAKSFLWALS